MPDVSAALIVLAGSVVLLAGGLSTTLSDLTRQRFCGLGFILMGGGTLFFFAGFLITTIRLLN